MKTQPIPVRLDPASLRELRRLKRKLGITQSELLRLAVRHALPKFVSGEVNLFAVETLQR